MQISLLDLRTLRVSILSGLQGLFSPRWSPDGRYIMAMPLEQTKLMLYDFKTKEWTERSVARIGFPSWSGDGKYVYFDTLSRDPAIIQIRIRDGKIE
jgi:Tol biopolymer transport system component